MNCITKNILSFTRKTVLYFGFLTIPFWVIGFLFFSLHVMTLQKETNETDGIAVLTGADGRIPRGLSIFKSMSPRPFIISGMNPKVQKSFILSKIDSRHLPYVTLGWKAKNTVGNAEEIRLWVQKNNLKTILLITSFYHMPRSLAEVSHVLPDDVKIFIHPVYPQDFHENIRWVHTKNAWFIFLEYNKFLYVMVKHLIEGSLK